MDTYIHVFSVLPVPLVCFWFVLCIAASQAHARSGDTSFVIDVGPWDLTHDWGRGGGVTWVVCPSATMQGTPPPTGPQQLHNFVKILGHGTILFLFR